MTVCDCRGCDKAGGGAPSTNGVAYVSVGGKGGQLSLQTGCEILYVIGNGATNNRTLFYQVVQNWGERQVDDGSFSWPFVVLRFDSLRECEEV